jgi:hypothetical protein
MAVGREGLKGLKLLLTPKNPLTNNAIKATEIKKRSWFALAASRLREA